MKEKPYNNFDYIVDIANLLGMDLSDKSIENHGAICERLSEPMIYYQMRLFHRVGYVLFFITGVYLGVLV